MTRAQSTEPLPRAMAWLSWTGQLDIPSSLMRVHCDKLNAVNDVHPAQTRAIRGSEQGAPGHRDHAHIPRHRSSTPLSVMPQQA
jgi:hypothetical protein